MKQFWIADFGFWIEERKRIDKKHWLKVLVCSSDNRKSKTCPEPCRRIKNPKLVGLSVIAFLLVMTGAVVEAQQGKIPRLGYLTGASLSAIETRKQGFRQGLRELGYEEGRNIFIDWRSSEGKTDRNSALAADLVRLKVDMIVTGGSGDTRAAKKATATIPIVMAGDGDPVGNGFVASLARPGGNITGLATLRPEISGKRLELLKEIVPKLARLAVFVSSSSSDYAQVLKEIEFAAGPFGMKPHFVDIRDRKDVEAAFRTRTQRSG